MTQPRIAGADVILGLCLLPAFAGAQQDRPNFSGTWVMNAAKSHLEVPVPDSTIFVIEDNEPVVRIFRTHVAGGKRDTATVVLRTDSSQTDWVLGTTKLTSRSWWEGGELVFWIGYADPGRVGGQVVRYSISPDRQTFTAIERVDTPSVKHLNRWVFDRRD